MISCVQAVLLVLASPTCADLSSLLFDTIETPRDLCNVSLCHDTYPMPCMAVGKLSVQEVMCIIRPLIDSFIFQATLHQINTTTDY